MLRCLLQLNKINDIKEILDSLDENILQDEEILKVKKLYENFYNSNNEVTIDDIIKI